MTKHGASRGAFRLITAMAALALTSAGAAAGAPSASAASANAYRHGLGLVMPAPTFHPLSVGTLRESVVALDTLPSSVDLTADAPTAGDQGAVNSCVSWAVDYTAMGYYLKHNNITGAPLAPMYTYSQLVGGQNVGTSFEGTFGIATDQGVDTRAHYWQGNYDYTHTPDAGEVSNTRHWVISGYHTLDVNPVAPSVTDASIKTALAAGKPVVIGIPVYDNFFSLNSTHSDYNTTAGNVDRTHAVTALGYDSYGLKIENSWGTSWGNNGFARLSWNFIGHNVFAAYSVDGVVSRAPMPQITAITPAFGANLGGTTLTLTGSHFANGTNVLFGGLPATNVVVQPGGKQLTLTTPPHPKGIVSVVVSGNNGTSATSPYAVYRYVGKPIFTSVTSRRGLTRGGTKVTITGGSLFGGHVHFGTTRAIASVNASGSTMIVTVPAHDAGVVTISITGPAGTVNGLTYHYVAP